MGEAEVQAGITVLQDYGIPNYPFPERAARSFKAMSDYREVIKRPTPEFVQYDADNETVRSIINKVLSDGRVTIGDFEAREILTAYDIKIPHSAIAASPEEAIENANKIGYPVVLKIASPDILHKTDVGGVKSRII